jgi:hypothetical protein
MKQRCTHFVRLGWLYCPRDNPGYVYTLVRVSDSDVQILLLVSNTQTVAAGFTWTVNRYDFEHSLACGSVRRLS